MNNETQNTTSTTTAAADSKTKQPTPCERATAALGRSKTAAKSIKALVAAEPKEGVVAEIAAEAATLATQAKQSASLACDDRLSFVRRQAASVRAKNAADGLETIERDLAALIAEAQGEADEALIERLENAPGYTKNPEWLAAQERREARLHA